MVLGALSLAVVAAVFATFLDAMRRVEAAAPEPAPWWLGYARDAVNVLGFMMFSGMFAVFELPGHLALLAGASLALSAYGLEHLLAKKGLVTRGAALAALGLAAGLLLRPIEDGLAALTRELF